MNNEQIVNDFRRRYEGSFVYVESPGSKEQNLFFLDSIQDSPTFNAILNLSSDILGSLILNLSSAHSIKFPEIPVGVFQSGANAVVCRRRPRKQYRRGICQDNTDITHVSRKVIGTSVAFDFNLVNNVLTKRTFSVLDALEKLNKKQVRSVALKNNYALCQSVSEKSSDFILFFMDQPIATVDSNGKVSRILDKVFTSNINSLFGHK